MIKSTLRGAFFVFMVRFLKSLLGWGYKARKINQDATNFVEEYSLCCE
jgi:hypothetical protein